MKKKNYEETSKWNVLMKKAFKKKEVNDINNFITSLGVVGLGAIIYAGYILKKYEDNKK